ncbi:MAG TPA: universal stress protein [Syntrophorhabdaceae bacterium]|nr:universal stress protein [Syntrophorhabdaceae bacterium]
MFKKILCPVDFSEFTDEILEYALDIARKYDSELHLIHIIPNLNYFTPYESFFTPENLVVVEKNMEAEVNRDFETLIAKMNFPVKKVIRNGTAFIEIIDYVKSESIDLVILGTHGRSGLEHVLIGSVAEKVVRKSPCPVLTIRPKGHSFKMP